MATTKSKPNILMIVTDQQRRDTIGAYGSQIAQTPNVDRLAAGGMTFDYAFTPCGLCTPVRSSMLTGVYPHTHNILTNNKLHPIRTELEPEADILTKGLKAQGYQLGYSGKWHVNSTKDPVDFGFDRYVSLGDYGRYRKEELGVPFPPETNNYVIPTCGVDPVPAEQCRQAFLTDGALDMLRDFAGDEAQPFFIRLDFHGPHAPNVIPEPYASMYDPASIPPHPNFDDPLDNKPAVQKIKRQHWETEDKTWEHWQRLLAFYYGEITLIDDQVGRLLAELERLGLSDNTLVIYFSDHGDTIGAHKIWNKDYTMYDEIYRVPFIARFPGMIEAGSRCDEYIHHGIDLTPTLLEVAGADVPDGLHGQSLVPLMRGEHQGRLREAFCEFHGCHMGMYTMRMLQTDRFKYVFHTNDIDELYDHDHDRHELHNVAADPAYADNLHELKLRMVDWMAKTDDHLYNEWIVYWLTGDLERATQAPGRMNTPW
jgi:arylsulfatase A-like enzyme